MSFITRIRRWIALMLRPGQPGPDPSDTGIINTKAVMPHASGPILPGSYTPPQWLDGKRHMRDKRG